MTATAHRRIFIALLALLAASMVTSVWMANLAWVLLGANWLLEGRWREKWDMARSSRLLQAYAALYALLLLGMGWTEHTAAGWAVLQVKLPLLVVPLVLLTTRPVAGTPRKVLAGVYTAAVLVVSVIGLVRMLTIDGLPYREAVPYISHIRFALNCCMAIYLCAGVMRAAKPLGRVALGAAALWLLVFIMLIRSYTALAVMAIVPPLVLAGKPGTKPLLAVWLAALATLAGGVAFEAHRYYTMHPLAKEPQAALTANGRPYIHANDGIVESGNYVNNYICTDELRAEWSRRSAVPYDSLQPDGYTVQPKLVRYLNALGLTKDSVGVWSLTQPQIADIERGIPNPAYTSHNPLRKMVCVMLFEHEFHTHTHQVRGFTMIQRFELWKATWHIVVRNRMFGVGTGDVDATLQSDLCQSGSELCGSGKRPHNQYLSLMAALGIVGFASVAAMFLRALAQRRPSALMLAWLLTVLVSMLTEDTLDTLAGILFCTFFLAIRPNVRKPHSA